MKIWHWLASFAVIVGCAANAWCRDQLVFDSYDPPAWGGYSSPNAGAATQISVSRQLTISRVAVLNEMLSSGELRFAILSYPEPQFLYLSDPKAFERDSGGQQTWKLSDPLKFTFEAGMKYLVGYVRSVAVDEDINTVANSSGGITSDLAAHALSGFSNPTYGHLFVSGGEESIRVYIPEPGCLPLLAGVLPLLIRRRR